MLILDQFRKRVHDFESVLEATKDCYSHNDFVWRGKTYHGYEDWANQYTGWQGPCFEDDIYRATRFELSCKRRIEYFLFFPKRRRVYYILNHNRIVLTEFPKCDELELLMDFYYGFAYYIE